MIEINKYFYEKVREYPLPIYMDICHLPITTVTDENMVFTFEHTIKEVVARQHEFLQPLNTKRWKSQQELKNEGQKSREFEPGDVVLSVCLSVGPATETL